MYYTLKKTIMFRYNGILMRMLVGAEQAASTFRVVQLQGLEAHVISQTGQEGKERLHGRFVLCHPPLSEALSLFVLIIILFLC
jgi:hypothetical protein